jgi:adenosylcobinamide amidohydrolase
MELTLSDRWLVASFAEPVRACSWAIVGGGLVSIDRVAWCEVRTDDLMPPVDPRTFLLERLRGKGMVSAVGLLTSRSVAAYSDRSAEAHGVVARCVATVGLGNALRAGDPAGALGRIGTINLLVHLDTPLTDEGLLEASAIATEAKTAAVLEAGVLSGRSGRPATGTGTDCTVVTCTRGLSPASYAGKHTTVGALVGAAVEEAISGGVARWLEENAAR